MHQSSNRKIILPKGSVFLSQQSELSNIASLLHLYSSLWESSDSYEETLERQLL